MLADIFPSLIHNIIQLHTLSANPPSCIRDKIRFWFNHHVATKELTPLSQWLTEVDSPHGGQRNYFLWQQEIKQGPPLRGDPSRSQGQTARGEINPSFLTKFIIKRHSPLTVDEPLQEIRHHPDLANSIQSKDEEKEKKTERTVQEVTSIHYLQLYTHTGSWSMLLQFVVLRGSISRDCYI